MSKSVKTNEVYLKEKLKTRKKNIRYTNGKDYGINNTTFNFMTEPVKEPYGDVVFTTGYDENPDYTSTFLMTAEEAMELGKMLIDTAYDAMNAKRVLVESELCDAKLSFLVLKRLIDSIAISRVSEKLENYDPPYYKYIITAYKDKKDIYSYATVYNLSYFTKESEINYWIDKLTDKRSVNIELLNWDPYKELKDRQSKAQEKIFNSLSKYNLNLKPTPIKK